MQSNGSNIEKDLWQAADELRANSGLKGSEYSLPVLGLIFLRYADHKFQATAAELAAERTGEGGARQRIAGEDYAVKESQADYQADYQLDDYAVEDYQAKGALYLPAAARFATLTGLAEWRDVGKAINEAMAAIEAQNPDLKGALPTSTYARFDNDLLVSLIRAMKRIPMDLEGDMFGRVYEYFLGRFASAEGQKGGEFFTPTAIVKLIVGIIAPYHGRIFDPACGSGGMFVQSARFIEEHRNGPAATLSIYGQERVAETVRLCRMNLAVHGLAGDIKEGNAYYDDPHTSSGKFDYVMANPPFNVNRVERERLKDDPRFPFGMPRADNANFLWIQLFYSALSARGRAGFVMANSASDAGASEQAIRQQIIASGAVDVMVAVSPNFFYNVTLPCTLWFFDRGKQDSARARQVLFIDARQLYRQIDRAHRDWTPAQVEFLANIARWYRGEAAENLHASADLTAAQFPEGCYRDVPGLCKAASIEEIEAQGWSLNPGRYVGIVERLEADFDFNERLRELNGELEALNLEAQRLEQRIAENVAVLLEEK